MIDAVLRHLEEPSSRGLANAVSRAVGSGSLTPGAKLPPIRTVAAQLHLSPTTVSAAWALLARSGTIRTDGRRGTFVAEPRTGPSRYRRALERTVHFDLDLSTGVPDPALLPDLGPALRRLHASAAPETYLDEPVVPELLDVLHDDWPFAAGSITVVDGALDALDLIVGCFVRFGDRVAVENPCFPPLLDLLEAARAEVVAVELDDDGPTPASLARARDAGVKLLFFQPRAQNPTGASVTAQRAAELAEILLGSDVLVVENDSAGAVASSPLASLGPQLPQQTLHVRSFSKSHGPDLRLAAVGGSARLVGPLVERRRLGQGWTSRLLQRVLLDLLMHRSSVNQVERARREYARRRALLVAELAGQGIEIGGRDGLNLWVPVADEASALVGLAARGIGATPGGPFMLRPDPAAHLRITAGLLASGQAAVAQAVAAAAGPQQWSARR